MSKKRSWIPFYLFGAAVALVVLLAWVNRDRLHPVEPGRKAPEFQVFDLDGNSKTLADYRGKVVLVNIWATWCAPCQKEIPSMQRLREAVTDEDFAILAISIDAPAGEKDAFGRLGGDLVTFSRVKGITFRVLHDPTGRIQETYQTTGVPESFILDRDGTIMRKVAGATEWDAPANVQLIQRLLSE